MDDDNLEAEVIFRGRGAEGGILRFRTIDSFHVFDYRIEAIAREVPRKLVHRARWDEVNNNIYRIKDRNIKSKIRGQNHTRSLKKKIDTRERENREFDRFCETNGRTRDRRKLSSIESLSNQSRCWWKRRKPPLGLRRFASIIRGIGRSVKSAVDFAPISTFRRSAEGKSQARPSSGRCAAVCWNGPCQQPRADWWANWRRRWPADPPEADDSCEQYRKYISSSLLLSPY